MNNAEAQKKGKTIKAFDNAMWVIIFVVMFGPIFIGIFNGLKVPDPLANALVAWMVVGPFLAISILLPIKALLLRAIDLKCSSCGKAPPVKKVTYALEYSLCPRCNKPFITDPSEDLIRVFGPPGNLN